MYPSLHSLPGLSLGDSIGEQSSTLAQFVPYQLNSSNADALQSLFPSTLPPSRGGDSVASSSSYALPHREYDFSVAGSSSRAGPAKQRLPHDLRGSGLAYQSVMSTPYATDGVLRMIDKSPDGKKKNSRHSQTSQGVRPALRSGIASGRPNTSHMTASGSGIGGARNLSRTGSRRQVDRRFPLLHSGKSVNQMAATAADRSGFGRRDGLDGESTGEFRSTFDPAASFADMTSSLAKLDPLCLNLSAGLHPKRGTQSSSGGKRSAPALDGPSAASFDEEYNEFKPAGREQSWVSFAEGTMAESFNDYYEDGNKTGSRLFGGFSGDWQGQQLTQADVFNTAPQMASEFLVDTEFVRQLFIDGTTMEEAQNLVFKMQVRKGMTRMCFIADIFILNAGRV